MAVPVNSDVQATNPFGGPPKYTVNRNTHTGESGYIFYAPYSSAATRLLPDKTDVQPAAVISTKSGRIVWERNAPDGEYIFDFKMQKYMGNPVLTWWQGRILNDAFGDGRLVMADARYEVIREIEASQGRYADLHEFQITADDRVAYIETRMIGADLTGLGGPKDGKIFGSVAVIRDLETNEVVFEWDAAQHVSIDQTFETLEDKTLDPFHMNSIDVSDDGRVLISMRGTSTVYCVDLETRECLWSLGGKAPTVQSSSGAEVSFQHDARFAGPNTIRIFNNNSNYKMTNGYTEVKWIKIDTTNLTADLLKSVRHPERLVSGFLGNAQPLSSGGVFGSWGAAGHIYEFAADGALVFDASLPIGPYRAYLSDWSGHPPSGPTIEFQSDKIIVSWNGAVGVKTWKLSRSVTADSSEALAEKDWEGYRAEFAITPLDSTRYRIDALDKEGNLLGASEADRE